MKRGPVATVTWFLILLVCSTYCFIKFQSESSFDSNILSLIPDQFIPVANPIVREQLQRKAEQRFIILVKGRDKASGLTLAKSLKKRLATIVNIAVDTQDIQFEQSIRDFYKPYRHQLLSEDLRHSLSNDPLEQIVRKNLTELYSPVRPYSLYPYDEDPFNLGGKWLQQSFIGMQSVSAAEIPSIKEGEQEWYVVSAQLNQSPYELGLQAQLKNVLLLYKQDYPEAELLTSGLIFHAIAGTQIAQKEVSTVGLGSLLAIMVLVVAIFRSTYSLFFMLCVLACSSVVALTATWLVFGQVHLVTLAFGSTLLGLAADYCFHYLVKVRALGQVKKARNLLLKGLVISVVSSVFAYLAQVISPFPGLQQFAVFVSSGLIAAGITVFLLAEVQANTKPDPVTFGIAYDRFFKRLYLKTIHSRRSLSIAVLLFVIIATFVVIQRGVNDDVRLLNTSGQQLVSTEQRVGRLLGSYSAQRYFLIEGESSEEVLQRAEDLSEAFNRRPEPSAKSELISPASIVPSIKRQASDYRLVQEKIYGEAGASSLLCKSLNNSCSWIKPITPFHPLVPSGDFPPVVEMLYPMVTLLQQNTAVVFFKGDRERERLWAKNIQLPGVRYIDQVHNLTEILKGFRQQVSWILLGFLVFLSLLSVKFFGYKALIIIGSVTLSGLAALLFSAPLGITLFHVLALLLVIGIAVDTSVFYITPGLDRDTWAASSLACITSLIAFGLLSLSAVPLLQQFGKVVFFGLITAWLVTPVLYHLITGVKEQNTNKGAMSG